MQIPGAFAQVDLEMNQSPGREGHENAEGTMQPAPAAGLLDRRFRRAPSGLSHKAPSASVSAMLQKEQNTEAPASGQVRCDVLTVMAIGGVTCIALAMVVGVVLELTGELNDHGKKGFLPTPCQLQQVGAVPSMVTSPFQPASPQWIFGVMAVGVFLLRKYFFAGLTQRFYGHLPENKQEKVSNYMLELVGTTAAIAVCSWAGFWDLLFHPSDYTNPNIDQAYKLVSGSQMLYAIFLCTYLTELAFDKQMRLGLILHHWTTVILAVWGIAAIYLVQQNTLVARAFFALSLYMSTEQNVFIEMLLYQRGVYWPSLYTASVWYYLVSRIAIMVGSLWTWWDMFPVVWTEDKHNSWVVYSLWLFVPFANLILNATQFTTVQSLFGIAATVRRRHEARQCEKVLTSKLSKMKLQISKTRDLRDSAGAAPDDIERHRSELIQRTAARTVTQRQLERTRGECLIYDAFVEIDFNQSGGISKEEWLQYVEDLSHTEWLVPYSVYVGIYDDMCNSTSSTSAGVSLDTFMGYFCDYFACKADFSLMLLALCLKRIHDDPETDERHRSMVDDRHQEVLEQIVQQVLPEEEYEEEEEARLAARRAMQRLSIDPQASA